MCHRCALITPGGLRGSQGQRLRWVPLDAAHQPLAGPAQARFLLHFLPQPVYPPLELFAFFFIIPPRIKYEPRSRLPSGTVRPHPPLDREPACPWKKICISGRRGANLQGPLLKGNSKMAVHKAKPFSAPPSESERPTPGIGFVSSLRARSEDLSIGTLTPACILIVSLPA